MSDHADFLQLLTLLRRDDTVRLARGNDTEFRAFPVPHHQLAPVLDQVATDQWNIWYEINPSLYSQNAGRSSAEHITRLVALYADLDFKTKPHGMSSLPECMEVVDALSSILGVQPAAIVHTGGGIHPYWPLADGQITDVNRADMQRRLKRWGALVKQTAAANGGDADSVYDLPRILRVPGTTNVKDGGKRGTSVDFYPGVGDVDCAWVDQVLDDYNITVDLVDDDEGIISPMAGWEWADVDCSFCAIALNEIQTSLPTSRHHWALKYSATIHGMIRGGCLTEDGFYRLRAAFIARFEELLQIQGTPRPVGPGEMKEVLKFGQLKAQSWSKQKLGDELRGHVHSLDDLVAPAPAVLPPSVPPLAATGNPPAAPVAATVSSIFSGQVLPVGGLGATVITMGNLALAVQPGAEQRLRRATYTDTGNAENLAQSFRGRFIWVPSIGWHRWADTRWEPDTTDTVTEAAKDVFLNLLVIGSDDDRKWYHKSLSRAGLNAALELAKTVPYLIVNTLQLDANAYELNTPGGIVDLRTAVLRPADPATDFHSFQAGQTPARIPIPKFLAFMEFAVGDPQMVTYLQRLFGAAAIGKLLHHIFPIFIGVGANGKTTLLDVIGGVLGQYASVMPQKFLIQKRGESHPTEIAQLRGVRMAIISEVPPAANFDEDLVKSLTGETRLKARYMGRDFFEFENTCTPFLAANHLPAVKVGGSAFWRRTRKIDFESQVLQADQNPNLVFELLRDEGPGILQWVIDGAAALLAYGLQDPPAVLIATRAYQLEEDTMARFMQDTLVDMDGVEVVRAHVYELYRQWTHRQGYLPLPFVKFCREITQIKPGTNLGTKDKFTNLTLAVSDWQALIDGAVTT